jgi:thioredoxin 1
MESDKDWPSMSKFTFEITTSNFDQTVLQSDMPVLVDFWAEWCPPCLMLAPLIDKLAEKYQGKLHVGKVDVDQYYEISERFNVFGFPTLILFRNGQPIHSLVGFKPFDRLEAEIVPHLQVLSVKST